MSEGQDYTISKAISQELADDARRELLESAAEERLQNLESATQEDPEPHEQVAAERQRLLESTGEERQQLLELLAKDLVRQKTAGDYPWTTHPATKVTREVLKGFLQNADKSGLAGMMGIEEKSVRAHLISTDPIIFGETKKKPFGDKVNRGDIIMSFLSLGRSTYDNGFPVVGEKGTQNVLESGYALHVMGDVKAVFKGDGDATAMFMLFRIY